MRVFCYAQHLTGVGHAVLPRVIANELATAHDVYLVEGGRFVPAPASPTVPTRIPLPVIGRAPDGQLVGGDGTPGDQVFARRADVLIDAIRSIRPDAVLVDHYPFSKWELGGEVATVIGTAREANPDTCIVSSLRDVSPLALRDLE